MNKEVLCLCDECYHKAKHRTLKVIREWTGAPCDFCGQIGTYWVEKEEPKPMLASKISLLDDWETDVLTWTNKSSDQVEKAVIVAFDAEDESEEVDSEIIRKKDNKPYRYFKPQCQGFTFAAIVNGKMITEKLDGDDAVSWKRIEAFVRSWLNIPVEQKIYWLTHYSPAELRNISDWKKYFNPKNRPHVDKVMPIHESTIHLRNWNNVIIDTYAYFVASLDDVADSIGMKKGKLETPDGKGHSENILRMKEVKKKWPNIFWEYATNDSVILIAAFTKLRQFYRNDLDIEILNTFQHPTLASAAVYLLRKRFLAPERIAAAPYVDRVESYSRSSESGSDTWLQRQRKTRVLDEDFQSIRWFGCRTYMGARREANYCGFIDKPVTMLDYKGMYNVCGQYQPLPIFSKGTRGNEPYQTPWKRLTAKFDDKATLNEILKMEGFVRIKGYKHPQGCQFPIVADQQEYAKRLLWPLEGSKVDGELPFFTIFELRLAIENFGVTFDEVTAYGFIPSEREINHPARKYLEYFNKMKDDAQARNDSFTENMAKLFSNALIGKFVQATEDDDTLEEIYGILKRDKDYKSTRRQGKPEPKHKKLATFFTPEWAALILGRARGLLGLTFASLEPITGHTDSAVFFSGQSKQDQAIAAVAPYGGKLEVKWKADGFWIMRSAVYIALKKKDGLWQILLDEGNPNPKKRKKPLLAHHAISVSNLAEFYQPVIDAINNKTSWKEKVVVHKSSLATLKTELDRGIPLGCQYLKEAEVKLMWDFKRVLPPSFNIEKDLFTTNVYCGPYESVRAAHDAEKKFYNLQHDIRRGRPTKEKATKTMEDRVKRLKASGQSERQISEALKIPRSTVHRILRACAKNRVFNGVKAQITQEK